MRSVLIKNLCHYTVYEFQMAFARMSPTIFCYLHQVKKDSWFTSYLQSHVGSTHRVNHYDALVNVLRLSSLCSETHSSSTLPFAFT